ncbi:hypothetical protein [Anaerobiospirillum sp. NML120511]|nr:hypothetical protein [Anaerobiospirillum sp. NML120511]
MQAAVLSSPASSSSQVLKIGPANSAICFEYGGADNDRLTSAG